jgi:hypothetical protein
VGISRVEGRLALVRGTLVGIRWPEGELPHGWGDPFGLGALLKTVNWPTKELSQGKDR